MKTRRKAYLKTTIFCVLFFMLLIHKPLLSQDSINMRTMRYTPRSIGETITWQTTLRSHFFELLKLSDLVGKRQSIELSPQILSRRNMGDYLLKEIEINSTPTRRIRFMMTIPTDAGHYPAVVSIHGHGGKPYSVYEPAHYHSFALELAKRKYVTIAPMVSQHEVYEEGRTLMGERLWDVMRCVDYLTTLHVVDNSRIGCAGLSLGGEMAMWLGAMDERISATLSSGFLTQMDQMEQNHCMCWKFDGLRELADFADIYSLIAPRALLCQNGWQEPDNDFTVPLAQKAMDEIQLIYRVFTQPEHAALVAHPAGHVIDLPSLLVFFDEQFMRNE